MAKSLQDILKRRQQEEFVGREEQLSFFHRNLRWEIDDARRRFVINISGQGGVGKTWLLRRFRKIAEEFAAVTAYADETKDDVPGMMGRIAEQFDAQGHSLKTFAERYKVYRQRRQEIEADPEAPQGFPPFLGRALAKGGLGLARQLPVGGVVADFVDEEAFASLAGDFTSYVVRKIRNKDEVRLVLEPVEVLTPLFLANLQEVAEKHSIALFFDTYERTGNFLDQWLRDVLEGRHGDVPVNILLVIAGRDELDRNHWAPYEGLLARLPLDPFTEEETHDYLSRKGITDDRVMDVILRLSGRLPLLVATLAAESPDDPEKVGDPAGEAIERFLRWVEDPKQRQVALDAALPRLLNRDVLAVLVGDKEADVLFAWLRGMPFVEKRGDGWAYHEVVRTQMLRYKRQEAPKGWGDLHGRLAVYYENLRDGLGLEEEAGRKDETWQRYALEALYHRLCQAPQMQLSRALNGFLAALEAQHSFAQHWVDVIRNAGEDADAPLVQQRGQQLVKGMKAYAEDRYQETSEMFTALLEQADIEARWQAVALGWRGISHVKMRHYEEALADFDQALELDPKLTRAMVYRGVVHRDMKAFEKAFRDFSLALELGSDDGWVLANRGITYWLMGCYEESLADHDRAIELRPDMVWLLASRGRTYQDMGHYEEALADLSYAIELDPDDAFALVHRGRTYVEIGDNERALADLNRAVELDSHQTYGAIVWRGIAYRDMRRLKEALADFNLAMEMGVDQAWVLANRAVAYRLMQRYEESLADFDRAIELRPDMVWPLASRGRTYQDMGRYSEALTDFSDAIELYPYLTGAILDRGILLRDMGCYEEALADFDRVLEQRPDHVSAIVNRGITNREIGRYDEALADFSRAIELEPDDWTLYSRALTYRALGQTSKAVADVTAAIQRAWEAYEKDPQDWRNTFNLALYHLAAGKAEETERLYQEALSGGAPPHRIRKAIRYLDDLPRVFPDHLQARAMRDLLQEHLQEIEQ